MLRMTADEEEDAAVAMVDAPFDLGERLHLDMDPDDALRVLLRAPPLPADDPS